MPQNQQQYAYHCTEEVKTFGIKHFISSCTMKLILESADAPPAVLHGAEGDSAHFKTRGVGPTVQNTRSLEIPCSTSYCKHMKTCCRLNVTNAMAVISCMTLVFSEYEI